MVHRRLLVALVATLASGAALAGCGDETSTVIPPGPPDEPDVPVGSPTPDELRAATATCGTPVGGPFATDIELSPTVLMCGLRGAVFWTADLDVDCDGRESAICNHMTDDAFQNQTSATDAQDRPLDAVTLPYVVIPLPSQRFDYPSAGIALGTVVAVVYGARVRYGVFADEGPEEIIGEASHAMAVTLGIDPDPNTGGSDGPVTYIAFTGAPGMVTPIGSHTAATERGARLATQLVAPAALRATP